MTAEGESKEAPKDTPSTGRRLLADAAALTIAGYLVQPIMFASNLLVRRKIGPLLAGTFATLVLVQSYTQLLNLGVLTAAERELPFFRGANDRARCDRIRIASLLVALASGLLVALGLAAYGVAKKSELGDSLFRGLMVWTAMAVITQWSQGYLIFLRTEQKFQYLARNSVVFAGLTALGNVIGVYAIGFDGLLVSTVAVGFLGCVAYTRVAGFVRLRFSKELWPETRSLIAVGIPLLLLGLSHVALNTIDGVLTLRLMGTEALGLYTLAISGGSIIFGFGNSLSNVLYPTMRERYGKTGNADDILKFVARPMLLLASVLPLLAAPVFFLIPVIVRAFVPKFAAGIPAFHVIMAGVALYALVQIPKLCLLSLGRTFQLIGWAAGTALVSVTAALVLVRFGLPGIAAAACTGHLFGFIGVTTHVLFGRNRARAIVTTLAGAIAPTAYAAVLFFCLESLLPRGTGFVSESLLALGKLSVFAVVYLPVLLWLESRSGLIKSYLLPTWRRIALKIFKTEDASVNP